MGDSDTIFTLSAGWDDWLAHLEKNPKVCMEALDVVKKIQAKSVFHGLQQCLTNNKVKPSYAITCLKIESERIDAGVAEALVRIATKSNKESFRREVIRYSRANKEGRERLRLDRFDDNSVNLGERTCR